MYLSVFEWIKVRDIKSNEKNDFFEARWHETWRENEKNVKKRSKWDTKTVLKK